VSYPVARLAPNGFRGVALRGPLGPVPMPRTVTIGICEVGRVFEPQMAAMAGAADLEAWAPPRILCDESGQLYEWSAERLTPLSPHHLPRAMVSAPDRGYRLLFPEPGCSLVVHWNEFRSLLESQIAHPERLRDGHRVGVRAQVYEVTRPQSLGELAEAITGDREKAPELTILTDTLVSLLGLTTHLPPRMRRPYPPDGDTIMAHERIVRLELTSDPTASPSPGAESPARATPAPQCDPIAPQPRADKESIPQAFLRPWEFTKSRDEVLYELTRRHGFMSAIRAWLDAVAARLGSRRERRRWEALRSGKTLDAQLWSVRPPRRGLDDRGVRDWAARTLEHAGYNVQTMLLEWEIFWRRKLG
jgi:hypothetical protein